MTTKTKLQSLITGVGLAVLSLGAQALTLNLDATNANNGVSVDLAAGDYPLQYLAGSWNPWGRTSCSVPGDGCDASQAGWINNFSIWYDNSWHNYGSTSGLSAATFMTSDDALVAGQALPLQFTLGTAQTVQFWIRDEPYTDNLGGLTLSLAVPAVPEPSSALLMMSGLAGVAGLGLRRRRVAVI